MGMWTKLLGEELVVPSDVEFRENSVQVYDDVGSNEHKLDIYVPPKAFESFKSSNGYPVIYYIHGGAWHLGDKVKSRQPCEDLAKEGYLCVATTYSLTCASNAQIESVLGLIVIFMTGLAILCTSLAQMMFVFILLLVIVSFLVVLWAFLPRPHVEHPDHILDVAKNFQWTLEHVAEYGGDPTRICVMGHSAGGHLASLLSTNFTYLESVGVSSTAIKGCISVSGVYSDKRLKETKVGHQLLTNAFGYRLHYYDAFPIYNITEKTPPFLLINAGMDISLKRHTLDFHYALRQAGVFVDTIYFEDKSHWNIMEKWHSENRPIMDKVKSFLTELYEYRNNEIKSI
jgi:acetyl esterase/lipase